MLLLRSIFFAALIPGTVVVLVPRWIVKRSDAAGHAILFQSSALVVYSLVWFVFVHLFVVFYEERT